MRAYQAAAAFIASIVIWPTRALAAHAMEWIAYAPYASASHMQARGSFHSPAPARSASTMTTARLASPISIDFHGTTGTRTTYARVPKRR